MQPAALEPGQGPVPSAQIPGAHRRPGSAKGSCPQDGRQHIREIQEDRAYRRDGRVDRGVQREQHGRGRDGPDGHGRRSPRGQTHRTARENGRPPSRAKAKAIRDAEVTVASPQRYCATTIPTTSRNVPEVREAVCLRINRNAPSPGWRPPASSARPGPRPTGRPSRRCPRREPSGRCREARFEPPRPSLRRRAPRRRTR